MPWTPPTPDPAAPATKAAWQAEALWHLQQANSILHALSGNAGAWPDAAAAHAAAANAILGAIDSKLIT